METVIRMFLGIQSAFFGLQHVYFSEYFVAGFENTCQWWILELILN